MKRKQRGRKAEKGRQRRISTRNKRYVMQRRRTRIMIIQTV